MTADKPGEPTTASGKALLDTYYREMARYVDPPYNIAKSILAIEAEATDAKIAALTAALERCRAAVGAYVVSVARAPNNRSEAEIDAAAAGLVAVLSDTRPDSLSRDHDAALVAPLEDGQ